ncbi:MAG: hypothetical protein KBS35_00010 [Mycoplasma sp.]|nr:hypothetical protein [Candidatus Hennigella equi]
MEYHEITKTQFRDEYNVVKVLTDKTKIMKQLETFNSKNQAVAFGVRKQHKVTLEDVILEMRNGFKLINSRIDNLITKNHLKE